MKIIQIKEESTYIPFEFDNFCAIQKKKKILVSHVYL